MIKKCETCWIKNKYFDCFLQYTNFENYVVEYKCLICNKNDQHKIGEKLKERVFNTYKFSSHNNDKFILLLRKGVGWVEEI